MSESRLSWLEIRSVRERSLGNVKGKRDGSNEKTVYKSTERGSEGRPKKKIYSDRKSTEGTGECVL